MTRPELPPGWSIRPNSFNAELLTLCRYGSSFDGGLKRHVLVSQAWDNWTRDNPEWAAYLAHLESEAP
jgi:hypothetical protein